MTEKNMASRLVQQWVRGLGVGLAIALVYVAVAAPIGLASYLIPNDTLGSLYADLFSLAYVLCAAPVILYKLGLILVSLLKAILGSREP